MKTYTLSNGTKIQLSLPGEGERYSVFLVDEEIRIIDVARSKLCYVTPKGRTLASPVFIKQSLLERLDAGKEGGWFMEWRTSPETFREN